MKTATQPRDLTFSSRGLFWLSLTLAVIAALIEMAQRSRIPMIGERPDLSGLAGGLAMLGAAIAAFLIIDGLQSSSTDWRRRINQIVQMGLPSLALAQECWNSIDPRPPWYDEARTLNGMLAGLLLGVLFGYPLISWRRQWTKLRLSLESNGRQRENRR